MIGIKLQCLDTKTNKKIELKTILGVDYDEGSGVYKHVNLVCKNKSINGKNWMDLWRTCLAPTTNHN